MNLKNNSAESNGFGSQLSKFMGKFVVYTLGNDTDSRRLALQFFKSITTYFYPSSIGKYNHKLGTLLYSMSYYYTKRYGKQIRGEIPSPDGLSLDLNKDNVLIDCLLSIAWQGVYHKDSGIVSFSQRTIRNFAEVSPKHVLPTVIDQTYIAFEDPSKSHRTLTCLKILSLVAPILFNRKKYPNGAIYLQDLLYQTLPGLDPTDPIKSFYTLSFYCAIWYHLPFINVLESSDFKNSKGGDIEMFDETEDDARRATMCFKEWSLQFIDALCNLVEHQESESKSANDQRLFSILSRSMLCFWQNLSDDIYIACSEKFLKFVINNQQTGAKKLFGKLIQSVSFGNPEFWLKSVTKSLFNRVLEVNENKTSLSHGSEWALYILAQSSKQTGSALLPYLDKMKTVICFCFDSKEKSIQKHGAKLLRGILTSLTLEYPAEARNFPESL